MGSEGQSTKAKGVHAIRTLCPVDFREPVPNSGHYEIGKGDLRQS